MSTFQNKVVVIMGASSGIGEATTKKLAQEGAKLVIAVRHFIVHIEKVDERKRYFFAKTK
ncbi:hypothetical protein NP83_04625 [Neobacillus niacini]|nr:hypothetical protein NP83_04625 [Neobacillus niacini]